MSHPGKPVEDLSPEEAAAELAALSKEIAEHDRRYHAEDAPTISDAEYDALRLRMRPLKPRFLNLCGQTRHPLPWVPRLPAPSLRFVTRSRCYRSRTSSPTRTYSISLPRCAGSSLCR